MDFPFAALIATVVGSSGLVGGITLAVQHSRAARLRRSIRESMELSAAFGSGERPSHALRAAATMDAYRLASISLMQLGGRYLSQLVFILVGAAVATILAAVVGESLVAQSNTTGVPTWVIVVGFGAIYISGLVWILDQSIRRRRDRLVERLVAAGEFRVSFENGRSQIVESDGTAWPTYGEVAPSGRQGQSRP